MNTHRLTQASRRAVYGLGLAGVAALLAMTMVVATPHAAQAATAPVDPSLPIGPLSALPSTATGAATGTTSAGGIGNRTVAYTYALVRSPEFWNAYAATQAGTATAAQTATVANSPKPAVPWTKVAPLTKAAGVAGAAFTSYQLGSTITAGVLDLVGTDANNVVCKFRADDGGIWGEAVAFAAGQQCGDFGKSTDYTANSDGVPSTLNGGSSCLSNGVCASFVAILQTGQRTSHCFRLTGIPSTSTYQPGLSYVAGGKRSGTVLGDSSTSGDYQNRACWDERQIKYYVGELTSRYVGWSSWNISDGASTGTVATVTQTPTNPERYLEARVQGSDGLTYTGRGLTYREGDARWSPPEMPTLPPGVTPGTIKIVEHGGSAPAEVMTQQATPEYQAQQQLAPECSNGTCLLDLQRNGVSCFQSTEACADWYTDPNKASTYACRYGSHPVPLSECTVYAPTFKPNAKTSNAPLGDPVTGEPIPNPVPVPNQGTSTNPTTGAQEDCLGKGWSSAPNPLEWVLVPVKCSLQWAFVPRTSEVDKQWGKLKQSWAKSGPGQLAANVALWDIAPTVGGCAGIPVDIPLPPDGSHRWTFSILYACDGPLVETAAISRTVLTISFLIWAVVAMSRYIGRTIGFTGLGAGGDTE